jgi:hypothetical protein
LYTDCLLDILETGFIDGVSGDSYELSTIRLRVLLVSRILIIYVIYPFAVGVVTHFTGNTFDMRFFPQTYTQSNGSIPCGII